MTSGQFLFILSIYIILFIYFQNAIYGFITTDTVYSFFHCAAWHRIGNSDASWAAQRLLFFWYVVSNLSTVRSVAHQWLLDPVDQKLPKATAQHELCFLVAPVTHVGYQDLTFESPVHLIVNASGSLPVMLNLDKSVWLVPNELIGLFFRTLGFRRDLREAIVPSRRWLPPL